MKAVLLTLLLCANVFVFSQLATNDWRMHVSYTNPSSIASNDNQIFCAFQNGLLEYDRSANEVSTWSYTNHLNDVQVSTVYYDPFEKAFWIGYRNGNIDKIKGETIINMPDLKLANVLGSKKINSFYSINGTVFAVADFGILNINPVKNEIRETYYTNENGNANQQIIQWNDSLYTLTPNGIYKARTTSPLLADFSQWQLIPATILTSDTITYSKMVLWNNALYLGKNRSIYGADEVLKFENSQLTTPISDQFELNDLTVIDNRLHVVHDAGVSIFESDYSLVERFYEYQFSGYTSTKNIVRVSNGDYFFGDKTFGLIRFTNNWNNQSLTPNGPPGDLLYRANSQKGKLIFSEGNVSKFGPTYASSGVYTYEEEKWKLFNRFNQQVLDSIDFWDMNGVAIHPKDKNIMAISGCGKKYALYIIRDGEQVSEVYGLPNSLIEKFESNNDLSCITEVQFDSKGNLWMINTHSNYPLKVLTKDGQFYRYDTGFNTRQKYIEKLTIDKDDNPWFTVDGIGIVGYSTNGTFDDVSDDKYKVLNNGPYTGALPNNNVTDIVLDVQGKLWITTTEGFSILSNPNNVFGASNGSYNTYRPKIEYGEFTENFFGETYITCGIVDGGNRKWFGTFNSGLFCIAEDGYSIIKQFNTANSKLISNQIFDLDFNENTGELFVVTDIGLISIRTDASKGKDNYEDVLVFPNPVHKEFEGVVTIQGIKYDSDVKITDMAGNLVYKTSSNGGTATWNLNKVSGERVATGVYLIWTAPKEGKGKKVGKVTVIR